MSRNRPAATSTIPGSESSDFRVLIEYRTPNVVRTEVPAPRGQDQPSAMIAGTVSTAA